MEDRNYGTIRIKLDEMIEKQNISKNKIGSPRRNAKDPTQPVL